MKCLECGSDYIKKVGTIVEKDNLVGKYKVPNVEYYECKKCHDRLYSIDTCKVLDKERLKQREKYE